MEANELIHEFMGHDWTKEQFSWRPGATTPMTLKHLEHYQTSWNWLMPVVEKIEQGNYGVKLCRKRAEIFFDDTKEVILWRKEKSRIESTWAAVVAFIQWHNKLINEAVSI